MKVVSIINYKGGVGKTTLTANLGAELAWSGLRVLLIDLDAQASLTFSFITPDIWAGSFEKENTIKSWFDSFDSTSPLKLSKLVQSPKRVSTSLSGRGKLDVIYSHLGLINVDLELATKLAGANLEQAKKNFIKVHRKLLEGLEELKEEDEYDVVLIDCPPNFNIVTKTAIVASDYILVPTRPDELSTLGIDYLIRSIQGLVKDYNDYASLDGGAKIDPISPAVIGVVITMVQEYGGQPISAQRAFIEKLKNQSQLYIFDNYIKRNESLFSDAPVYGVPIVLLAQNNESHQSVVEGLEAVTAEFRGAIGV